MTGTIHNPTKTFIKYFNHGGPNPEGGTAQTSPALTLAEADPTTLSRRRRSDIIVELFADLVAACRKSDLVQAEAVSEGIARMSAGDAPEVADLSQAFLAETRGDYRLAESYTTACLRRTHVVPEATRPVALVKRATQRMRLGLLDAALTDLAEAERGGPSMISLQGVAIKAIIHWWRGDQGQALDALEQGPLSLIKGVDFGVGWYALAAELVKNGQIFHEDLGHESDCLARDFWDARPEQEAEAYVSALGPHIIRHELALGHDCTALLAEMETSAAPESAAGRAGRWCAALAAVDSRELAEIADQYRDRGVILYAIQAYRDAAACASTDDSRDRLIRRGRFLYDRLSRAVKVTAKTDLPAKLARQLTDAEQNVVAAVAQGMSNKEAADLLHCSVRTIESHLTSSYKKLGIKRRTQVAVLIAQANVSLDDAPPPGFE